MPRRLAAALVALAGVGACTTIETRHGYAPPDPAKGVAPEVGVDSKETVLREYGTPTLFGAFHDDVWYYVASRQQARAVLRAQTSARQIIAIRFDQAGMVAARDELGLEDGIDVAFVDRETPTKGREITFLEQIFGSVGRLPGPIGGQQGPLGGGQ